MKVFGCTREGSYTGGIILVAANSIEEALEAYRNDSDYISTGMSTRKAR